MENEPIDAGFGETPAVPPAGQEPISISEAPRPVDPKAAERRAKDTHRALGAESPGVDELLIAARNGADESYKNSQAIKEGMRRQGLKAEAIRELARTSGQAVNQETIKKLDTIMALPDGVSPDIVMENKMGESVVDMVTGVSNAVGGILKKAMELNPIKTSELTEITAETITKGKIAQRISEDAAARAKEQSWAGWGMDVVESMVPGRDVYLRNKAFPDAKTGVGILPGKTLEDNIKYLHTLAPEEFERQAKSAFEYLAERNIFEAQRFAEALTGYSNSDANWDTVFGAANFIGIPGIATAKGLAKGLVTGRAAKAAMGPGEAAAKAALATGGKEVSASSIVDVLKRLGKGALSTDTVDEGKVLMDTGHIAEGAQKTARQILEEGADNRSVGGMPRALSSIFNPKALKEGVSQLGNELVDRIVQVAQSRGTKIMDTLTDAMRVERGTVAARAVGEAEAFARVKEDYRHVEHAILDVKPETRLDTNTNVYETSAFLGKTDGTLFDSAKQAVMTGKDLYGMLRGDIHPIEMGDGKWALKVTRAHDETTEGFRKAMVIGTENTTPVGRGWGPMGWLRSAEDLLSPFQSRQRHVAQHGMQRLVAMAQEIAQDIGGLSKESKEGLSRVLEANKSYAQLQDDGYFQLGRFNKNVAEFENEYRLLNGRPPTAQETQAYFSYIQLNDMDYLVRNFTLYRDKVRQGIQQFEILGKMKTDRTLGNGTGVRFEGKVVDSLPKNINSDAGVFLHTNIDDLNQGDYVRLKAFEPEDWKTIDSMLKGGYRIIQVANPSARPLARLVGDERPIHFIITKDSKTGALPYQQIPYRPGGHKEYVTPHFVKQPKITRMEKADGDNGVEVDPPIPAGLKPTAGWKLHLNTEADAETNNAIAKYLNEKGIKHKVGKSGGQSGKDITIYIGAKDAANRVAKEIEDKFGSILKDPAGDALVDDAEFTRRVRGRFDADGDSKFHQYGKDGSPILKDWIDVGEPGFSEEAMRVSRAELERKYGEFYTGRRSRKSVTTSHSYDGDTAVLGFNTEAEARKYAQHMDNARLLLKDGKLTELDSYLENNLPYTRGEFKALFERTTSAGLARNNTAQQTFYKEARLSLNEPIVYLPDGKRFTDNYGDLTKNYENFEDNIRSPYNLYDNIDKEYAGERNPDLYTIREGSGTDNNPLLRIDRAEQLDPFATMTRAMANAMRNRFMDDYKIQAVESFVAEFGDLIKGPRTLEEVRLNPEYYVHSPTWDTGTTDKLRLADAKAAHRSLVNFLGTASPLKQEFDTKLQKIANSVYDKYGQKASDNLTSLRVEGDPFRYGRKVAFHLTLGLFNPVQLLLQAQTMTHVLAVAGPKVGIQGIAAGTMMNMLRFTENPNVIKGFAKKAAAFGWKEADFIESYEALKRTGWNLVEGETAWHDDMLEPKMFDGLGTKIIDKGTFFFKEGEKQTRLAAWGAAFHEWKLANPGKVADNKALGEILQRADTLSVNMTRASNASWNQGMWSIPTQFLSYQVRLMEQFMGKRLTSAEKLRAFATYSAMYGIPGGLGAAAGVLPWYEDIRKTALEKGYDTSDPMVMALHNGLLQTAWHVATGQDLNFAQRMGPNGISLFKDALNNDKSMTELLLGPSGSILSNTVAGLEPVLWALASPFRPDDQQYMPTANDVLQAFQGISSVNNFTKMAIAFNTGMWTTKNGTVLKGDVGVFDALMMGITGTSPTDVADAFLMTKSMKSQKEFQDSVQKKVNQAYTRAIKAYVDEDPNTGDAYMAQVRMWVAAGGWRPDQMGSVFSMARKGNEDMIDKIKKNFVTKAPAGEAGARLDQLLRNGQ